jgi:hypothetical protein
MISRRSRDRPIPDARYQILDTGPGMRACVRACVRAYRFICFAPAVGVEDCQSAKDLFEVCNCRNLITFARGLIEERRVHLLEHHADLVRLRHRRKDPSQSVSRPQTDRRSADRQMLQDSRRPGGGGHPGREGCRLLTVKLKSAPKQIGVLMVGGSVAWKVL